MRFGRVLFGLLVLVVIAAAAGVAYAWRPEIAAVDPPARNSFDQETLRRGAQLAALGNCNACHTADGGKDFAGGRAIATPFGTLYSTNITPDSETGIGRWSAQAFGRAMHQGVDREGRHLYPAFPYDHFTKMTDEDARALYAFMMTREGGRGEAHANALRFPFNIRPLLAGWNLLFFHPGVYQGDPARDAEWNRGAYLAEGVAHCSACHSPRNALGAEEGGERHMAGGRSEGWDAPALNARSPAPVPWDAESLYRYLRHGSDAHHGAAGGPMLAVVRNMQRVPDADVRAIAVYVALLMGKPSPERQREAEALIARVERGETDASGGADAAQAQFPKGAALFAGACAVCHEQAREHVQAGAVNIAYSSAVRGADPTNALRVLLEGVHPSEGERGPWMPSFRDELTDAQIADLLAYVHARFAGAPAWNDIPERLRRMREGKDQG